LTVVVRHIPVAVESDTDLALLRALELFAVYFYGMCMSENDIVPNANKREKYVQYGRFPEKVRKKA
jgi:hypothetical protein